jgi:hypothetical protein
MREVMEVLEAVMKWIVAPIAAFVFMQYRTQQEHSTDIAVLKAEAQANKQAHDREFKQLQDNFKAVFTKLDNIEQALRK